MKVIPRSVQAQLSFLELGERTTSYPAGIAKRRMLYKNRLLNREEVKLGYKKCPLCGFPTKNRFRCHGCWLSVVGEEEGEELD